MPGALITELYRKRRAPELLEEESCSSKRSKNFESGVTLNINSATTATEQPEISSTDDSNTQNDAWPAKQLDVEHSPRKENRSPNHLPAQSIMEQQFGLPADFACPQNQEHDSNQTAEDQDLPEASAEAMVNLLLLAGSSLQDGNSSGQPEQEAAAAGPEQTQEPQSSCISFPKMATAAAQQSNQCSDCQAATEPAKSSESVHHTVAGLRPSVIASTASLAAIDFGSDSDSSSEDDEPAPKKPRKVEGCGRYGQELNNIAGQALRQTNLQKKKCANRTVKTVRQLKTAPDHSCEAAQKAVDASKAAEEAVKNLAAFADAFDDLVKQAVHAANAAAQARADYAASVVTAEMAAARRDRVLSKRGKRRSVSPKGSKRLSWASDEQLVQARVFCKADSPSKSCSATNDSATVFSQNPAEGA